MTKLPVLLLLALLFVGSISANISASTTASGSHLPNSVTGSSTLTPLQIIAQAKAQALAIIHAASNNASNSGTGANNATLASSNLKTLSTSGLNVTNITKNIHVANVTSNLTNTAQTTINYTTKPTAASIIAAAEQAYLVIIA